jgi:hypothetical protein
MGVRFDVIIGYHGWAKTAENVHSLFWHKVFVLITNNQEIKQMSN